MEMVSITELRKNAKAVLDNLTRTKTPIAILQRSKPVAYILDAESFSKLQLKDENNLSAKRTASLEKILQLKEKTTKTNSIQEDSVQYLKDLRATNRHD